MIAIQPSPSVDDTALLSTLVQSGAALVAIIAGLLVARLVALVGERVSLERRVQEREVTREERRKDFEAARQESLDYDGDDFISRTLELYFEDPDRSFELARRVALDRVGLRLNHLGDFQPKSCFRWSNGVLAGLALVRWRRGVALDHGRWQRSGISRIATVTAFRSVDGHRFRTGRSRRRGCSPSAAA